VVVLHTQSDAGSFYNKAPRMFGGDACDCEAIK